MYNTCEVISLAKKYYAVRKGKKEGIYETWEECKAQVHGYKKAEYKSFKTKSEAENYMNDNKSINEIYGKNIDEEMRLKQTVLAYVDGSYSNKHHIYSYGCVILEHNKKTFLKALGEDESLTDMRNVAGELLGSMVAIQWAIDHAYKKIILHYDYTGIEYWAKGEWRRNKKGTQDYKSFIDQAKKKITIEFIKIEAHSGDVFNEKADTLAKEAIEAYEAQLKNE